MSCIREPGDNYRGKFEGVGELGEKLYMLTMDGGLEDEVTWAESWYGLINNTGLACVPHAIVYEDSQGFFGFKMFDTAGDASRAWQDHLQEIEKEEIWAEQLAEDAAAEESYHEDLKNPSPEQTDLPF